MNLKIHRCFAILATASVVCLPLAGKAEEKVQKITFIEDDAQKNMASKIYTLKHTKAADVAPFIRSAVVRYCEESNVSTVEDTERNRQMIIVSTGEDMIEHVDKLIAALDRPAKVAKASNITGDGIAYGVYQPQFRATEKMLDIIVKGEVSSGEADSDMRLDSKRNMFYFKDTPATVEDIKAKLAWLDKPIPQVRLELKVYQVRDSDLKDIGIDYLSWKNGPGIDLFSTGGRFSQNYNDLDLTQGAKWNKTTYFQFNPKWNTKYIDFLTSKGKAKVLHTSEITIGNNAEGKIEKFTQCFVAKSSPITESDAPVKRGNTVNLEAADRFGFSVKMTPSINTQATTLKVKINNSSLIGYTSDGSPRIQQGAEINTKFMISNSGTKLVIGGIEKRSVMQVSGGIPILKDIPLLGWAFSTETEATKRSQLLVVAEVLPADNADNQAEFIKKLEGDLIKAGESNTYGYRQYLIDSKRN